MNNEKKELSLEGMEYANERNKALNELIKKDSVNNYCNALAGRKGIKIPKNKLVKKGFSNDKAKKFAVAGLAGLVIISCGTCAIKYNAGKEKISDYLVNVGVIDENVGITAGKTKVIIDSQQIDPEVYYANVCNKAEEQGIDAIAVDIACGEMLGLEHLGDSSTLSKICYAIYADETMEKQEVKEGRSH